DVRRHRRRLRPGPGPAAARARPGDRRPRGRGVRGAGGGPDDGALQPAAALDVLPTQELSSDDLETAGAGEYLVSRALLELQVSRPGEALELLRSVSRATGERAEVGYCGAVTAL